MNIFLKILCFIYSCSAFAQNFTTNGMNGLGGGIYDHVIVSAGYLNNPLFGPSQVGFYAANQCNAYATQHCAGFETGIGILSNITLQSMNSYAVSNVNVGSNSTIVRYRTYAFAEDSPAQNNAVFAAVDDRFFTGNWFINYRGDRPSKIGGSVQVMGDLGVGRAADAVVNSRSIVCDGVTQCFIRLYINGVEKARITVTNAGMYIWADSVTIPSLAGSGSRAVRVDANGTLSAP